MDKLFTFAFIFFLISLVIYRVKSCLITTGNEKGQISQAWTLYILTILHVVIGLTATIEYFWFVKYLDYRVTIFGVILFSVGVAGRFWALNTLGKYHSPQIEIREDQPLITLGPYHYIRHPIYSFTIVEVLGCTLIPNAYFALCLTIFVYTPLLLLRLFLEEKALIQAFGEAYLRYRETVPCLIPFTKWAKDGIQSTSRIE